ncbi:3-deoxy-8-phosphooctulonate synthase [Fluviispira multicolorata]|uniref:3-deoxy-8-phosphooctulonate synthase n=1 Tax=Fluviispira multicolorata TaxID=2654512 RepID=A0A833JFH6_9BACT|nr:3-deoxy-8-phosphooctulonate synthase [Fluviispira multicolorata]KAB8033771.1 3-deoxy-8-phosphooctulonate synthase [Fluviispira multicolorata]
MSLNKNLFPGNWDGNITHEIRLSRKKPVIMAGPCMFENREIGFQVGSFLKKKCEQLNLPFVFKSSYDKANRTSANSVRGPGVKQGLEWLKELRQELNVPILTDVHSTEQALEAGNIVDIIQIPAFLCKQRELLVAAASTGKVVQIKKGQWATPEEMLEIARFLEKCGNSKITLVERGSCFGYNNLVVDFRNLVEMHKDGHAVIFDATHSVQLPGAGCGKSSGLRHMVHPLVRAAVAVGVDGIFMEVHPNPEKALSDADTQLHMQTAEIILEDIAQILF